MSEKKIAVREHANETGSVLAVADADLLEKVLKDGIITFTVSKTFYHEKLVDENELKEHLDEARNINLIGEHAYRVAAEAGLVGKKPMKRISGVPHTQIYKL